MALSQWPEKFQRPRQQELVAALIESFVCAATDKAVGFAESLDAEVWLWLPLSQVDDLADLEVGEYVESLEVPRWLAEKNELAIEED